MMVWGPGPEAAIGMSVWVWKTVSAIRSSGPCDGRLDLPRKARVVLRSIVAYRSTRSAMRNTVAGSSGVQSVARALGILEELAGSTDELGVTELGRRLGVHKATASRLLATLAEHGLVERNPVSDRYRLGFGLVRLAAVVSAGLDLVRQARPVLEWLAPETGETVN